MELKALAESIDQVNRNLTEMRETAAANNKSIETHGQQIGENVEKLQKMEADMAEAIGAIMAIKRANIAGSNADVGDFVMSKDEQQAKAATIKLWRKGDDRGALTDIEQKALSSLSAPDGGFWVPKDTNGRIISRIKDNSPLRRYASAQTLTGGSLTGPIDDGEFDDGWVGEAESRPNTNTSKVGQWEIKPHERYAKPKTTQTLLDDSAYDVESWIVKQIADRFSRREAYAFIKGNGVTMPRGIITQDFSYNPDSSRARRQVQKIKTGANGAFAAAPNSGDVLIDTMTALRPQYWSKAVWAMNRFTLAKVMQLKDSDGKYLWLPDFSKGAQGLLLGFAVDASFDHMDNVAANSLSIAFGNFEEAYQIVDKQGIRILRDPYSSKPFVEFYATSRVGGDVLNHEAYKVVEFKA